jgi:hypothetical protein
MGIAVDAAGNAFVTGITESADFPTTPGAFDESYGGGVTGDTYVAKLNTSGSALLYSTYLGGSSTGTAGSGSDLVEAIAIDEQGAAYVAGRTTSINFPTTPGAYDSSLGGFSDAFVTKLNPTGSGLVFSTYLGGSAPLAGGSTDEFVGGIRVDEQESAYIAGVTYSNDFPTTGDAFDRTPNGANTGDAFVTKLNGSGSALVYSTLLGGIFDDNALRIDIDPQRNVYVTGTTQSPDFPATPGAFDTTDNGGFGDRDGFVTKLAIGTGAAASVALDPETAANVVGDQHCVTASVLDAAGNPTPDITVAFTVSGTNWVEGSNTTDANGHATFCYTGELFGTDQIAAFADFDPANGVQDATEPGDTATKLWLLPSPSCRVKAVSNGSITTMNGDLALFRGEAGQHDASGKVHGREYYRDRGPAQPVTVSSRELPAIACAQDGRSVSIFGTARFTHDADGPFRIDLRDGGRPRTVGDSYRILLATGYDSGTRPLRSGDVSIKLK